MSADIDEVDNRVAGAALSGGRPGRGRAGRAAGRDSDLLSALRRDPGRSSGAADGRRGPGGDPAQPHLWRRGLVAGGCAVLVLDVLAVTRIRSGDVVPTALDAPVRAATDCITADDPNTLLALGVIGPNIQRDCLLVVDPGGYSHGLSRGRTVPRSRNAEWQQVVLDYLGDGQDAVPTRFGRGRGLSAETAAEIESLPVHTRADNYLLRQPPDQTE